MAQDGSKDSAATLEEWCSLYLNAAETSSELGPLLKTLVTPEPVHLEAAEVRVAEAMKEMTVLVDSAAPVKAFSTIGPTSRNTI